MNKSFIGSVYKSLVSLVLVASGFSALVRADEYFPIGPVAKSGIISSAVDCGGFACVLYNPAKLVDAEARSGSSDENSSDQLKIVPEFELSYVRIRQTYEHPDFDPVSVIVYSPVPTTGMVIHHPQKNFSLGLALVPVNMGHLDINGLPRKIADRYESLRVQTRSESYDLAAGVAYALAEQPLVVGLSVIRRTEFYRLSAYRTGDETLLMRLKAKRVFYIPQVGVNFSVGNDVEVGASYRWARSKTYNGYQKSPTSDELTDPKMVQYDPATVWFGFAYDPGPYRVTLNYNRLFYGAGRGIVREGLTSTANESDLRDVSDFGIRFMARVDPHVELGMGAARILSPWGEGFLSEDINQTMIGADFGSSRTVTRNGYGLYSAYEVGSNAKVEGAIVHSFGSREIGGQGNHPGYYQAETFAVSLGYRQDF